MAHTAARSTAPVSDTCASTRGTCVLTPGTRLLACPKARSSSSTRSQRSHPRKASVSSTRIMSRKLRRRWPRQSTRDQVRRRLLLLLLLCLLLLVLLLLVVLLSDSSSASPSSRSPSRSVLPHSLLRAVSVVHCSGGDPRNRPGRERRRRQQRGWQQRLLHHDGTGRPYLPLCRDGCAHGGRWVVLSTFRPSFLPALPSEEQTAFSFPERHTGRQSMPLPCPLQSL